VVPLAGGVPTPDVAGTVVVAGGVVVVAGGVTTGGVTTGGVTTGGWAYVGCAGGVGGVTDVTAGVGVIVGATVGGTGADLFCG
jgi:hypothetical protein